MANRSAYISGGRQDSPGSRLVSAMETWNSVNITLPEGQFGRSAVILSGGVVIDAKDFDFEFTVPFDDDAEANESELVVYNLTWNTINKLVYNNPITIMAGYKEDTGIVCKGYIKKVSSKQEGTDRVTTIKILDDPDRQEHSILSRTFNAGASASEILKALIEELNMPLAVFETARDRKFNDAKTVDGDLMQNIRTYAEICGISVYINKGQVFARPLTSGDAVDFTVSEETGLIESPEEFTEENEVETGDDGERTVDRVHGYKLRMLLQHRITTAAIIHLKSNGVYGRFRVRSGQHIFNESESITELEVIDA